MHPDRLIQFRLMRIRIKIETTLFIFHITKNSLHPDLFKVKNLESYVHSDQGYNQRDYLIPSSLKKHLQNFFLIH